MRGSKLKIDKLIDKALCGESINGLSVSALKDMPTDYTKPIVVTAPFYFDEIKQEIEDRIEAPCVFNVKDIVEEILREIYC